MSTNLLKIECMDPRRRAYLDEGDALRVSRAGGFAGGKNFKRFLPELLLRHKIERIEIRTHEDCGAVKVIDRGLKDRQSVDTDIYRAIIAPVRKHIEDPNSVSISNLEDIVTEMQRKIAVHNWKSYEISCRKGETNGQVDKDGRTLLLTTPTHEKLNGIVGKIGLDPNTTFIITLVPGDIDEMAVDPKLALQHLGIGTVILHGKNDRQGVIRTFGEAYKSGDIVLPNARVFNDITM